MTNQTLQTFHEQAEQMQDLSTVADFVDLVELTLKFWLAVHTEPAVWAEHWMGDSSPLEFLEEAREFEKGTINNRYFSFDLDRAVKIASLRESTWERCTICGEWNESGFLECECDEPEIEPVEMDDDSLGKFADDMRFSCVSEYNVWEVMINEAFPVYRDHIHPLIVVIIDDVKSALSEFEEAETNYDRYLCAIKTLGIMHHNGYIFEDYARYLSFQYETIEKIRKDGITAIFSQEQIDNYLSESEAQ